MDVFRYGPVELSEEETAVYSGRVGVFGTEYVVVAQNRMSGQGAGQSTAAPVSLRKALEKTAIPSVIYLAFRTLGPLADSMITRSRDAFHPGHRNARLPAFLKHWTGPRAQSFDSILVALGSFLTKGRGAPRCVAWVVREPCRCPDSATQLSLTRPVVGSHHFRKGPPALSCCSPRDYTILIAALIKSLIWERILPSASSQE